MATDAPLMGEPIPVELMNTVWADRDGVHDSLGDRDAAYAWLESVAPRIDIDTASLARAAAAGSGRDQDAALLLRRLRDSLRRLAADATADDRAAAASPVADVSSAVGEVNEVLRSAASWPVLVADGNGGWTRRVESGRGPLAAAVGSIASEAIDLFAGPLRGELRACRAPGCVLYFVRHHPRREWCSAACGNRARVARHYQRHAGSRGSGIVPQLARLEFHRAALTIKCESLDDSQGAAASAAPSGLTLTGLVQHMAEVERNWFRRVLAAGRTCSGSASTGLVYPIRLMNWFKSK